MNLWFGNRGRSHNHRRSHDFRLLANLLRRLYFCFARSNLHKVRKGTSEDVSGPQQKVNFRFQVSDDFCTCHFVIILSFSAHFCRRASVGIELLFQG